MPTPVQSDNFNSYANNTAFATAWPGALLLAIGSSGSHEAAPDASQFCGGDAAGGGNETGAPTTWGAGGLFKASRTFTGLTPNAPYTVRFKMQVGKSFDSPIGAYPAAHTFTAGLQANSARKLIAVVQPMSSLGAYEAAGIPGDVAVTTLPYPATDFLGVHEPALAGWVSYSLATTADVDGHILITIGEFDGRNFQSDVYFDDIEIFEVAPPIAAAPGVKRAVLYLCEKVGNRIFAYGVGLTQVGDNYQAWLETWDFIPATETGRCLFRGVAVAIEASGAHTIGVTPIVDGRELPEQVFSGKGLGAEAYEAFLTEDGVGTSLRCRIRTIERHGTLAVKNITTAYTPVRAFP